jgi:hypothetical protein
MLSVLAALLIQAAAPGASPAQPQPGIITMPDWALKPAFEDVTNFFPKSAQAKGAEGRATIGREGHSGERQMPIILAYAEPAAVVPSAVGNLASVRVSPLVVNGKRGPTAPAPSPDQPAPPEYYPSAARARGIEGDVLLRCGLQEDGKLVDCVIVQETPLGEGFGGTAQFLSSLIKIGAQRARVLVARGQTILFPVQFRMQK